MAGGVWFDVMRCGVVRRGAARRGVAWRGLPGVLWHDMAWRGGACIALGAEWAYGCRAKWRAAT